MNTKLHQSNPTTTNRERIMRLLKAVTEDLKDPRNTGSVRQSLLKTQTRLRDMLTAQNARSGVFRAVTSARNLETISIVNSGSGLEVRCSA